MIEKRNSIYHRDHIEAFNNAKSKGLDKPEDYMYMYSKDNKHYASNSDNNILNSDH